MTCHHDDHAREMAVLADGYCPLCMATEVERLRAVILNIQSLAEQGFPIDARRLATRCRRALGPAALTTSQRGTE